MDDLPPISDWNDAWVQGVNGREAADMTWVNGGGRIETEIEPDDLPRITALTVRELLEKTLPRRQMMLAPWLQEKALAMCHAYRGVGKTNFGIGVAWAVATGGEFLGWTAPKARRVLYLDGEMPAVDLQARFREVAERNSIGLLSDDFLKIAAADLHPEGLPDLGDPDAQGFYADVVGDADLVIGDNLSTLCPNIKESDNDSWTPVQKWALNQRRAGKSVLWLHHDGKSGQQRGSSRKEDPLDTVMQLKRPPDYSAEQGCRFELRFEKNRGFHGADAAPFEAWLKEGAWCISEIRSGDDLETLKALSKQGCSIREIAERTGMSKSTVQRRLGDEN